MNTVNRKNGKMKVVVAVGLFAALILLAFVVLGVFSSNSEEENKELYDYVRVGIKHSSNVVDEYTFKTDYGIEFGLQTKANGEEFKSGAVYTGNEFTVKKIGVGYSISVISYEKDGEILTDREKLLPEIEALVKGNDVIIYDRFSVKYGYEVRLGSFSTVDEARAFLMVLAREAKGTLETVIVGDETDTLYLYDKNGKILCCFASNDKEYAYGVMPLENKGESVYLLEETRMYEGTLEFRRYTKDKIDGISVINILPTSRYIACVMSYEISPSLPHETHKMFSISVRNYTYKGMNKHRSVDFDLCCDTHCQAYRGSGRLNDSIESAVAETSGLVIALPDGKIADIYYSDTMGGVTVALEQAWDDDPQPHLIPFPTPWEKYREYGSYTKWTVEYSPEELYEKIKGYCPNIKGDIAKITTELANDSTYVYSITFTDVYGNSDTVSGSFKIKTMLGFYSANFVAGKSGQSVDRVVYSYDCFDSVYAPDYQGPFSVKVSEEFLNSIGTSVSTEEAQELKKYVKNEFGSTSKFLKGSFDVTENGTVRLTYGNEALHFTKDGLPDISSAVPVVKTVEVTLEGKSGNFVFDGMGWGHGVGLSQTGSNELIKMGYDFKTVLEIYFPGAKVIQMAS